MEITVDAMRGSLFAGSMPTVVPVDLGERSYDIHIGCGLLDTVGALCREAGLGENGLIITDANVGPRYEDRCLQSLDEAGFTTQVASVPAGEPSKCHKYAIELYSRAIDAGLDRKGFIIALGGGVVGDLAGFVAATFLRGLRLVQIPTSLLAMVDSAVGGKTGINLPHGKNLIGCFHQPELVVADLDVLHTLPIREYMAGLAEVVKYGVIADAAFFQRMEQHRGDILEHDPEQIKFLVQRSCEIKADVVRQDEREGGLRAILNYGHTLGHAIEQATGYGTYLHGEALSMGMVYAARVSQKMIGLPAEAVARQVNLLAGLGLPVAFPGLGWEDLRMAMRVDKKSIGSTPRFVLAEQIGKVLFGCEVSDAVLEEVWHGGGE